LLENEGDGLSTTEMLANAVQLLNAGHDATVHAIGNGVSAILAAGPDPAPLFASPEATQATVEEILRFDPPLHLFTRVAREPARPPPPSSPRRRRWRSSGCSGWPR